jgi:hypothetical protein
MISSSENDSILLDILRYLWTLTITHDDHEIYNDYSKGPNDEIYLRATNAWKDYLGHSNPTTEESLGFFGNFHEISS